MSLFKLLLTAACLWINHLPHAPVDVDEDGDVDLADWACVQNDGGDHAGFPDWMGGPGVDALAYRFAGEIVTVECPGAETEVLDFSE